MRTCGATWRRAISSASTAWASSSRCGFSAIGRRTGSRASTFESLMAACAKEGFRPFLLGATPAVLERAERALAARHPGLAVAGRHHGYFTVAEEDRIAGLIRASGADCLFIAMP